MKQSSSKKLSKNLLITSCIILFLTAGFTATKTEDPFPFENTSLSIEVRVADLVARMTLEEKVAQMLNAAPAIPRLRVPAYNWWNEALHGIARTPYKVTSYPQAIAMAATFDTEALQTMADYTSTEGRAINNESTRQGKTGIYLGLTYWSPNINIFRDPRWGRGQETYGEDPFLTASLGKAFVNGLQGNDPKYLKTAACAKHYAIHSGPESIRHEFNAVVSDYDLWDTYLPAFKTLVVDAKVEGVMCAYNAFQEKPCCGNDLLMNTILRDQWSFKGYATSDCGGIDDFYKHHKTSPNAVAAAADAVMHGTDVECGKQAYKTLVDAVKDGLISEAQIDISVKRLFTTRFRLGMFDPIADVPYAQIPLSVLESPAHQQQALKMAHESIVLLKNQNHLLPLSSKLKKIAILGPNAANEKTLLGNYNGTPSKVVTPLEAIKSKLGTQTEVYYAQATDYTVAIDSAKLKTIIENVKDAEVIIYFGGISPSLEGEEMKVNQTGFSGGDRTSILLPPTQTSFLQALKNATHKPIIIVMMTGSAIAIPWETAHIPAILNAWYGGQSGGTAIADVLFGDYNPSGKLPVTFYASDDDLADFKDYSMENRTYRYFKGKALYPFGFGLSYTNFDFKWISKPAKTYSINNQINCTIKLQNSGKLKGEEVVQAYIRYPQGEGRLPIKELRQFTRMALNAGKNDNLTINIPIKDLQKWSEKELKQTLHKGNYQLFIGSNSSDAQLAANFSIQ
jgi:beta-glucosidase